MAIAERNITCALTTPNTLHATVQAIIDKASARPLTPLEQQDQHLVESILARHGQLTPESRLPEFHFQANHYLRDGLQTPSWVVSQGQVKPEMYPQGHALVELVEAAITHDPKRTPKSRIEIQYRRNDTDIEPGATVTNLSLFTDVQGHIHHGYIDSRAVAAGRIGTGVSVFTLGNGDTTVDATDIHVDRLDKSIQLGLEINDALTRVMQVLASFNPVE